MPDNNEMNECQLGTCRLQYFSIPLKNPDTGRTAFVLRCEEHGTQISLMLDEQLRPEGECRFLPKSRPSIHWEPRTDGPPVIFHQDALIEEMGHLLKTAEELELIASRLRSHLEESQSRENTRRERLEMGG
jgi:hypothetical protein